MSTQSQVNNLRKSIYTPVEYDVQIPFKAKLKKKNKKGFLCPVILF